MTDAIFEKIVLMLVETPGMIAPAATATKPAIKAYSMRSCPRRSFQILSLRIRFFISLCVLSLGFARQILPPITKLSSAGFLKNQCLCLMGPPKSLSECAVWSVLGP